MKILLVTERYWPEVGAAPSRLANMAEGLKSKGCGVDALTSLPNYPKGEIFDGYKGCLSKHEVRNGVDLFRYWIYATVSKSAVARILNMFSFAVMIWLFAFHRSRIKQYDRVIIQTPTLVVAVSAMWIFKVLYHKKCILNVSDIWPSTAVDMGAMKVGSRPYKFMAKCERYLYRKSDAVLGQSNEILQHIASFEERPDKLFLYRNLQTYPMDKDFKKKGNPVKVVFSGMLGVAQDVAGIVKNIPFNELGIEFHILGGGKQLEEIQRYIEQNPRCNVFAHGFVPKEDISGWMVKFDASIVPLFVRIRGAVPSKIYDILPQGLPILFCGGGEGADFISSHNAGFVSEPGDYAALQRNLEKLRDMSDADYEQMSANCITTTRNELNFDKQMNECVEFLENL
jgi:glycosyltransferase involved in cell wall biosynthesis